MNASMASGLTWTFTTTTCMKRRLAPLGTLLHHKKENGEGARLSPFFLAISRSALGRFCRRGAFPLAFWGGRDAHAVERAPNEEHRSEREDGGEDRAGLTIQLNRQLDREQAEQGGELDDRVHGHRRSVFERVAHGVADDGGSVQVRAALFQFDFD